MTLSDDVSTNNIAASILSLTGQDLVTSNDLLLFYLTFTERVLSLTGGRELDVGSVLVEREKLRHFSFEADRSCWRHKVNRTVTSRHMSKHGLVLSAIINSENKYQQHTRQT